MTEKTMKCSNCQEKMALRGYEHVTKVGGFSVTDGTGQVLTCPACGTVTLSSKQLGGYERRAAVEILRGAQKPVSGEVLKFARKALGLRQKDLAARLECNEQQLSRWEQSEAIEMWLRLAMVALLELEQNAGAPGVNQVGTVPGSKFEIRKAG
jgi:DNA-binding transcriptional regulator YiaG